MLVALSSHRFLRYELADIDQSEKGPTSHPNSTVRYQVGQPDMPRELYENVVSHVLYMYGVRSTVEKI